VSSSGPVAAPPILDQEGCPLHRLDGGGGHGAEKNLKSTTPPTGSPALYAPTVTDARNAPIPFAGGGAVHRRMPRGERRAIASHPERVRRFHGEPPPRLPKIRAASAHSARPKGDRLAREVGAPGVTQGVRRRSRRATWGVLETDRFALVATRTGMAPRGRRDVLAAGHARVSPAMRALAYRGQAGK